MPENYTILPVTAELLDDIEHIEKTCFTTPWSRKALESDSSAAYSCWLAAVRDGKACAFIGTHVLGDEGEIVNIAVLPEHRRHGLARSLITKFFELHPELEQVFLEVRESNIPAQTLYASMDFKPYNIRKKYYENPVEDAILMRCAPNGR